MWYRQIQQVRLNPVVVGATSFAPSRSGINSVKPQSRMSTDTVSQLTAIVIGVFATYANAEEKHAASEYWPQWRGPLATGVAPMGDPPIQWNETENIRWKIPLPGLGHSTPIVWGDHVFVTSAEAYGERLTPPADRDPGAHDNLPADRMQRFVIRAIKRKDGSIAWMKVLREVQPHEGTHDTGSWASNSPVTDGEYLFAFFGSRGLYCLTMDGQLVWEKDFGDMQSRHGHGEGSSPALHDDTLVINWDHQGDSFIVGLDKNTGKEIWRRQRDEITSWSSPLIVEVKGKPQVIVAATNYVRGYDLATGKTIWKCSGLSRNVCATPIVASGIAVVTNSYDWQKMLAIKLAEATGDITDKPAVLWQRDKQTPYVPSPLIYDDLVYFTSHLRGIVTCVNLKTGKTIFGPARIPKVTEIFASPTAAAGRIYIPDRRGNIAVLKHANEFKVLAVNKLNDAFSASPVIVGNELYLRGEEFLYCIAKPK